VDKTTTIFKLNNEYFENVFVLGYQEPLCYLLSFSSI